MHYCLDPYPIYSPGSDRAFNPFMNGIDGKSVACGRCNACVKNRKQAWAAKLVAESLTSASVTFVTLTYAKDPEGVFRYSDVQDWLKLVRHWANRKRGGAKVRFFCIGENGEEKGRVHWHCLLFFDKPVELPIPKRGTKSEFWPHGWSDVQNFNAFDRAGQVRAARYCVGYAVKTMDGKGQRPRMSLKPALGSAWLLDHAQRTARAGLCPDGKFTLPGMVWSRGPRAGQSQPFSVRGSQIRHYIRAYSDEWERCFPDRDKPRGAWLQHYDPDAISPVFVSQRSKSRWAVQKMSLRSGVSEGRYVRSLPPVQTQDYWRTKLIACHSGSVVEVGVCFAGPRRFDVFVDCDGVVYDVQRSIAEVLDLRPAEVASIDKWIAAIRGPDWSVEHAEEIRRGREAERGRKAAARAARRAAIAAHCAETRQREALKAGVRLAKASDLTRPSGAA